MSAKTVESVVASFVTELREVMRDQLLSSLAHWEVAPAKLPAKHVAKVLRTPRTKRAAKLVRSGVAIKDGEQKVFAFVMANPGCSMRDIRKGTGLSHAQAGRACRAVELTQDGWARGSRWYPPSK